MVAHLRLPRYSATRRLQSQSTRKVRTSWVVAHKVVSHDEWIAARKKHLAKEKEFTHMRDQLSRERRDLPWELVDKEYIFEGEAGKQTLADLFQGRRQLVIYHAMFNPDTAGPSTTWTQDAPCYVCSFWMDNFN